MATIRPNPESGSAVAASGWIIMADVQVPGGTASDKVFQNPGDDTVLQSCTVSGLDIRVYVRSCYPKVLLNAAAATLSPAGDTGHYEGWVDLTIPGTGTISASCMTANEVVGAEDYLDVVYDAPPTLLTLSFTGGYPGAQTELKEDDTFDIALTSDKDFDQVEVLDYEAGKSKFIPVAATSSTTVSIDIADRGDTSVARPARVRVRDASTGAYSATRDTDELGGTVDGTDLVNCNNLHPSIVIGVVTYPVTQQALKGSETATVALTVTDFDTINHISPTFELSITNPTAYEVSKTVQRTAGSYNVSTDNLRVIATRAANDAQSIEESVVNIANVAATIDVSTPASRLRSGGNDGTSIQNHTITITGNQLLLSVDMDEDVGGGAFTGSWAGTPPDATWTRTLQVHDDDTKGTYDWQNLVATNLAGINTTVVTTGGSYELGGFIARDVLWQAFQSTSESVNVEVSDYTKVQAGLWEATDTQSIRVDPPGTTAPPEVAQGYSPSAEDANPHTVEWLDTTAVGQNTGDAYLFDYEEIV
jgi:hypothetical protein